VSNTISMSDDVRVV